MSNPIKTVSLPFSSVKCYCCDALATGVRDLRASGGMVEAACLRHRDSNIAHAACSYCNGKRPSLIVDGNFAHKSCEIAASL